MFSKWSPCFHSQLHTHSALSSQSDNFLKVNDSTLFRILQWFPITYRILSIVYQVFNVCSVYFFIFISNNSYSITLWSIYIGLFLDHNKIGTTASPSAGSPFPPHFLQMGSYLSLRFQLKHHFLHESFFQPSVSLPHPLRHPVSVSSYSSYYYLIVCHSLHIHYYQPPTSNIISTSLESWSVFSSFIFQHKEHYLKHINCLKNTEDYITKWINEWRK